MSEEVTVMEADSWSVDSIVASTGLPNYTIRKYLRGEELLAAAKRMVRTEKPIPYYYHSAARLLYAVALECGLKALWEIDNGQQAKYTHDLVEIFDGLKPERREIHRNFYALIAGQVCSSGTVIEALEANANMVKDFKYGDYDGHTASVVGGELVNGVVVGSEGALISYGQFVIDHLELTVMEHTKLPVRDSPS